MRSTVEVTGLCPDGKEVVQQFPCEHEAGAPDSALLAKVLPIVRGSGGLMVEGEKGSIDFYSMIHLVKINFRVNRISLASGSLSH